MNKAKGTQKNGNMYLDKTAMVLQLQPTDVHVKPTGPIEFQPTTIIINVHVKLLIFDRSNPIRVMPKFT